MRPRILVTLLVGGLALALAGAASAATFLHGGTTTGNLLAAGTPVMPRSTGTATLLLTGIGTMACTAGSGLATVGASGGATVAATGDSMTVTSCTHTLGAISFSGCHLVAPLPTGTVVATGATGGTVSFSSTFVRCDVTGVPTGCYYNAASATGIATNTGATLAYTNVPVTHTAPPGATGDLGVACGTTGTFSATLTDLTGGSPSTTLVLNQTA